MIKNYIKIAFRSFWRNKMFTLINVMGLSIGISAALIIYLIVHYDLTFDKFHKDSERIYWVETVSTDAPERTSSPGVCGPLPFAVKQQVTGLEAIAPYYKLLFPTVLVPDNKTHPAPFKMQKNVILTDAAFFNLFDYHWIAGSAATAFKEPYQVVLTTEKANLYFPGLSYNQVIGKTIVYDTLKTTVAGIIEPMKGNTDFNFNDFISYNTILASRGLQADVNLHNWGSSMAKSQLFIKLAKGESTTNIEQQLNTILKVNYPPTEANKGRHHALALEPLANIHFDTFSAFDDGRVANKTTLYGLLAIAAFLLLLGCINFVNLTTAQSVKRAKEIGIRKTMGSSRQQLIIQFLSETFLITLTAVIISALFAPVIIKLFTGLIPAGVNADLVQHSGIIVFLALLAIGVSLLSGFYPAIVLSAYKPVSVLKNQAQSDGGKTRSAWLRKSLTVTQFIIAQFFIMATVMVSKQIYFAIHKDIGFKKDAVVMVTAPYQNSTAAANQVLLNKLRAIPQIEMVSAGNDAPSSDGTSSTEGTYRDGKKEIKLDLAEKFGDENYIKLYHINLLAGCNLRTSDINNGFLINVMLAKSIGFNNPNDAVGKVIDNFNGDHPMWIIGVVADFHQESLHAPIVPLVILTSPNKDYAGTFHIALKPETAGGNEWQKAIAGIGIAWKDVYPQDDFEYRFVDETIAKFYESEQHTSTLLSWATALSVFISCLGLLGLAIYTTNQRTKEIGVRKVLGASVSQMVALLSTELVLLIVLAFVIVAPIAYWAMHKWIQGFADRTAISWWIFAGSGAGLLLVALITSSFQTVKAAIANPVKSLRSE